MCLPKQTKSGSTTCLEPRVGAPTFGDRPTALWIPVMPNLPSVTADNPLRLTTHSPAPATVRVQRSANLRTGRIGRRFRGMRGRANYRTPRRAHAVSVLSRHRGVSLLEEHQDIVRGYVHHRQGVYALYRRGKLYYVGLASNLRARLGHHLKDRHQDSWDRFSVYLTIGDGHLRELEALLLRIVKPTGNKQKGRFARSEDLRRRFCRDYYAEMRLSLRALLGKAQPVSPRAIISTTEGRQPVLAGYVTKSFRLYARHKGKRIRATVRKNGMISAPPAARERASRAPARHRPVPRTCRAAPEPRPGWADRRS
jgi:hypothetical protein